MECTIISYNGSLELIYGRQEFTGVDKPRFFDVPESLVDEVRTCPYEDLQNVLLKIQSICNEILTN